MPFCFQMKGQEGGQAKASFTFKRRRFFTSLCVKRTVHALSIEYNVFLKFKINPILDLDMH